MIQNQSISDNCFHRQAYSIPLKAIFLIAFTIYFTPEFTRGLHYFFDRPRIQTIAYFVIWFLTMMSLILIAFHRQSLGRIVWGTLFAISAALNLSYYQITLQVLGFDAMDMFIGTKFNEENFKATLKIFGLEHFLKPVSMAILFWVLIVLPPVIESLKRKWIFGIPLFPLMLVALSYLYTEGGGGVPGLPSFLGPLALAPSALLETTPHSRHDVYFKATHPPRFKNIVLIVDESIRGDYIDLNRDRAITPFLKSQSSHIINFGLALSGSNCSSYSNALIRMGANPPLLKTGRQDLMREPTIWQYAKQAGFKTTYIDGQMIHGQESDFMNARELAEIDTIINFGNSKPTYLRDFKAIDAIKNQLNAPEHQFIYFNKNGAHYSYEASYPKSNRIYIPTLTDLTTESVDKMHMLNSYRNAVNWVVDRFFKSLFDKLDLNNTLVIYTSDHGQNLLDDGILMTHCRFIHPIVQEALVPLLLITHQQKFIATLQPLAAKHLDHASHFSIFPTILDLFGYDEKDVSLKYYPSLFSSQLKLDGFSSGAIFNNFEKNDLLASLGIRKPSMHWNDVENLSHFR